jgi:hypothetical protein
MPHETNFRLAEIRICYGLFVAVPASTSYQNRFWHPAAACRHFDLPWVGCMEFRLTYSAMAAPTASLISTVLG